MPSTRLKLLAKYVASEGPDLTPTGLRSWREGHNLTQHEASLMLGVSAGSVGLWENGVRTLPHWLPAVMRVVDEKLGVMGAAADGAAADGEAHGDAAAADDERDASTASAAADEPEDEPAASDADLSDADQDYDL